MTVIATTARLTLRDWTPVSMHAWKASPDSFADLTVSFERPVSASSS